MHHENVIGGAEQYFHFGNDIFQDRVKLGSPMMNHRLTAGGQDPGGYIHRSGGKQHRCTEFLHEFASINWRIAACLAVLICCFLIRLRQIITATLKALKRFCLAGPWPEIQATRFAGGR
jgi:hypothetical protein